MKRILLISICLVASLPSAAQTALTAENTVSNPAQATPAPSVEDRLEQDMISMPNMAQALSKNLGQLHYLRQLCFGKSDQTWRDYASNMMNIEAPDEGDRRKALVKAFNAGFYDQKALFATCSEDVSTDAAAVAENARHLATMLGDPYRE
ncbi:MAG: TIGR02301 family protein [Robiginitomaculum sp.]